MSIARKAETARCNLDVGLEHLELKSNNRQQNLEIKLEDLGLKQEKSGKVRILAARMEQATGT